MMLGLLGSCVAWMSGCGDGGQPGGSSSSAPVAQTVDTAQVLALAQQSSESNAPFPVDGRMLTFGDTSDTTAPISVDP